MKDGTIKSYYVTTEYAAHFISGTVEGNDTRAVMREGYQLENTLIPLWLYYNDGTKLQLEDVLSQVIDILFHSLGSLSLALSATDWLLRNTNEGTPVSAITTPNDAFGIESFTISITWSWIFNSGETKTGARLIDLAKYVATTGI